MVGRIAAEGSSSGAEQGRQPAVQQVLDVLDRRDGIVIPMFCST
jgi:hypothetical protein